MIDFAQKPAYRLWAERQLGVSFEGVPAVWLTALDQARSISGVVIFSRHSPGHCEVTVVLRETGKLPRDLFLASAGYAFGQLDCRRVTAFIAVQNERSLKSAQRLGFRIEGRAREWFPTGDAFILGLLREDFILKDQNGQWKPPAAA